MNHAFLLSANIILVCFVSVFGVDDFTNYADVQDSYEMPIHDTCGTLLQDYIDATLRTLRPDERHWFYDSYVCEKIQREDNRTLEKLKGKVTLDYDNINDTYEQPLFKTCGTLLQDYWENYSLRNLTSSERAFYYDEDTMKQIQEEEAKMAQEGKDREWLRKMEKKVLNEGIDSYERQRTTDIVYDDFHSPVPKTTNMKISPIDDLYISQASNVSDTDISESTYKREMKYGDIPRWLADRYDKIHDEFIKKKDKQAIEYAVLKGFFPSTGRIVQPTITTRKRRMLTHRYDTTTHKIRQKTRHLHRSNEKTHQTPKETIKPRLKRNIKADVPRHTVISLLKNMNGKVKRSIEKNKTTKRMYRKITNEDGMIILKRWADQVAQGERELEREERKEKKEAEKLKQKMENRRLKEEKSKLLTKIIRSTRFTRKKKTTPTTTEVTVTTEDSWETTIKIVEPTRRPLYFTWSKTLGTYGHFNLAKEDTQPNAEQTEVEVNEAFQEFLSPSTQTKRLPNATTPRKRVRQSTTPYFEHTLPNRFNRTVYYWMYERRYAQHSTPTPVMDSCGHISLERSEERPLELQFMDYLFDTRRRKPTLKLNLTTVTISAREYESFLARHQIYRNVYEQHWGLATMSHWNVGDTRFQKVDVKHKLGADFYDRRPYSSTRRCDNMNYQDLNVMGLGNFTLPDFKNKKYTMADSYEYHDPFVKYLEDPGHVTANWTTIDFNNVEIPVGPHQRYPNGTLKTAEVLVKEDYELRKNLFGKSCEIYDEEFAFADELTKPSAEYINHREEQDKFFYKNVSRTIGPKHAQKSVYDVYEESDYEDSFRKWKEFKKNEALNNVSLMEETREKNYVDPQVIIDQAYKYTTVYNIFKRETVPTVSGEIPFKFQLKVNPGALKVVP